jgi:DNA topoisomerase-2
MATDASKFQEKEKNDFASLRPDVYVGSLDAHKRAIPLVSGGVQTYEDMKISAGLLRILIEIMCNAIDSTIESLHANLPRGKINVRVEGEKIVITNESGRCIPIEKMKRPNGTVDWIITVMFSMMFASSHYDDSAQRDTAGTYGIGAKMVNILSKFFSVRVRDGKQEFYQEWHKAVAEKAIVKAMIASTMVEVAFIPDMERFVDSVTLHENVAIVRKMASDAALFSTVPVSFSDGKTTELYDYHLSYNDAMKMRGASVWLYKGTKTTRCWILQTKDLVQESYVNGTPTYSHGKHVDLLVELLRSELARIKGLESISKQQVMMKVSFVLCSTVDRPKFNGACKDKLESKAKVDDLEWSDLADRLVEKMPDLVTDLKRFVKLSHFKEAKGTNPSEREYYPCTRKRGGGERPRRLWIAEGISAGAGVLDAIKSLYGSREYDGVFCIRGKTPNPRDCTPEEIVADQTVSKLIHKKVLNIRLDVDYNDEKMLETLGYDEIVIASDADVDGYHIRLLVIDMLTQLVPALRHRFLIYYTPILRLSKGGEILRFYTLEEWDGWQARNPTGWSTKNANYCKGLGSSSVAEIQGDMQEGEDIVLRKVVYDETAETALQLAFDHKCSNLRKEWILGQVALDMVMVRDNTLPVTNLVQKDLLEYSRITLPRAIPGMDGLNGSQRLAVYTALKYGSMKSDAMLGKVLEHFDYKHGVQSLYGAAAGLAVGYPGSNNLPIFEKAGNFGNRKLLSKDKAGSRYTHIALRPYVTDLFPDADKPILKHRVVNGHKCEPETLLPIAPTWIFNGAAGISTGWATFIPCYKPEDAIDALCTLARGEELKVDGLVPWFRHFGGKVELRTARDNQEETDEDGNVWKVKKGEQSMRITGKSNKKRAADGRTILHVTEIPPYMSTAQFIENLKLLKEENLKLEDPSDSSGNNNVDITLDYGYSDYSTVQLGLVKTRSLSSMYLLDENDKPRHYNTPEEALKHFFVWRIGKYGERKDYQMSEIEEKLGEERDFHKYLSDVLSHKFDPRPAQSLHISTRKQHTDWLVKCGYTLKAADRRKDSDTEEVLIELEKTISELKRQRDTLRDTTPQQMMIADLTKLRKSVVEYNDSEMCKLDVMDSDGTAPKKGKRLRKATKQ